MATCSDLCNQLGKLFVCENPKDSIFWFTTPWVERKFTANDTEQIHQACAYVSTRPKWTKLNANFVEISNVNKTCDGQHKHASWGLQQSGQRKVFATALEVHYPSLLCDAIAENIALALHRMGVVPATTQSVTQSARAFAHYQAGTTKIPTFVPEYKGKLLSLLVFSFRVHASGHFTWTQPMISSCYMKFRWGVRTCNSCIASCWNNASSKTWMCFRHECPECYTCLSLRGCDDFLLDLLDRERICASSAGNPAPFGR